VHEIQPQHEGERISHLNRTPEMKKSLLMGKRKAAFPAQVRFKLIAQDEIQGVMLSAKEVMERRATTTCFPKHLKDEYLLCDFSGFY